MTKVSSLYSTLKIKKSAHNELTFTYVLRKELLAFLGFEFLLDFFYINRLHYGLEVLILQIGSSAGGSCFVLSYFPLQSGY